MPAVFVSRRPALRSAGLALRRSTAASSNLGAPLPFRAEGLSPTARRKRQGTSPGRLSYAGRPDPRSPGITVASHDRRRRSPSTLSTPAEHPSGGRGCFLHIAIVKPCQADFLLKIDAAFSLSSPAKAGDPAVRWASEQLDAPCSWMPRLTQVGLGRLVPFKWRISGKPEMRGA